MLGQYARQEEEWVPVSDWGRNMKLYLDEVKRNAVPIVRGPKHRGRKVLADRALREVKTCKFCPNKLRHGNKSEVCTACHDKTRGKGPRPICSECKEEMNRTVKGGERPITICYSCTRKAKARNRKPEITPEELERRRQERLRKAREAYSRKSPIRHCHCGRQLQANNKSGLCIEHNGMAGQASYRARRKKAA